MIQWVTSDEDVSLPAGCPPLIAKPLCSINNMKKKLIYLVVIFYQGVGLSQSISLENAKHDLEVLKSIVNSQSSYFQISDVDLDSEIEKIHSDYGYNDSIQIIHLTHEIGKVIAKIGDRHSRVYLPGSANNHHRYSGQYLPYIIAPFQNKIVVLTKIDSTNHYKYYNKNYPFLKEIQGINVYNLIESYPHRALKAPEQSRLTKGSWYLENISKHLFFEHKLIHDSITITLTDGDLDTTFTTSYSSSPNYWVDLGSSNPQTSKLSQDVWNNAEYRNLDKWLSDSIAYFRITDMLSYKQHPYFESYLLNTIKKFESAKALIFDLRGNGGGTREILNTLAPFLIPKELSPWVANIAYVRNNQDLNEDIESMNDRFLYSYYSSHLSDNDREAIDSFISNFKSDVNFPLEKFSKPYFMILKSGSTQIKYPVYILVNEETFSAASVFTTAIKGLPNIKVVGVTTDGSSGRSRIFKLPNSRIKIRLSTMLSFQRNGKTLDGNGTEPDILLERKEKQILGYMDTQLNDLIEIIKTNN